MSRLALDIRRITPTIGAEIGGVDLSQLDDSRFAAVRQALLEHLVIVFREISYFFNRFL